MDQRYFNLSPRQLLGPYVFMFFALIYGLEKNQLYTSVYQYILFPSFGIL